MESYILTTVNRGTREERCNQAAHQLQGRPPVTFNSHSDHTICSAWYAHAILIARATAISASSSSPSALPSSSVSFLITTEHFHTSLVPHMKQITAKALSASISCCGWRIGNRNREIGMFHLHSWCDSQLSSEERLNLKWPTCVDLSLSLVGSAIACLYLTCFIATLTATL